MLFVACDLLTVAERVRLVSHLAERFRVPPTEVRDAMTADPRRSVPIVAEDVSVTVFHPQRWLT